MNEQMAGGKNVGWSALLGRVPCKRCPFRDGSALAYDADALEALYDGNDPACHEAVGMDAIFHHAPMLPAENVACTGHRAWLSGVPGFMRPNAELSRPLGRSGSGSA